jgi:predicted RNA methylase
LSRAGHHQPQYADVLGQFAETYHLEMLLDLERTTPIFRALDKVIKPETVFCELGCGTGLFSIYAAAKCRKVYAVERDPKMADVSRANIEKSEFKDKITLIEADALEVALPEKTDVIYCEMMSTWCVEEPQIRVVNRARKDLLAPDGVIIPERIVNTAEICNFGYSLKGVSIRAATPLFTGSRKAHTLSESLACHDLDFYEMVSENLNFSITIKALVDGIANSVRCHSLVQFARGIAFSGSDSLMPPLLVPLQEDTAVEAGKTYTLTGKLEPRSSIQEINLHLTK